MSKQAQAKTQKMLRNTDIDAEIAQKRPEPAKRSSSAPPPVAAPRTPRASQKREAEKSDKASKPPKKARVAAKDKKEIEPIPMALDTDDKEIVAEDSSDEDVVENSQPNDAKTKDVVNNKVHVDEDVAPIPVYLETHEDPNWDEAALIEEMRDMGLDKKKEFLLKCAGRFVMDVPVTLYRYAQRYFPAYLTWKDQFRPYEVFGITDMDFDEVVKKLGDSPEYKTFRRERMRFIAKQKHFPQFDSEFRDDKTNADRALLELEMIMCLEMHELRQLLLYDVSVLWIARSSNKLGEQALIWHTKYSNFTFKWNIIAEMLDKYGENDQFKVFGLLEFLTEPSRHNLKSCLVLGRWVRPTSIDDFVKVFYDSKFFRVEDIDAFLCFCLAFYKDLDFVDWTAFTDHCGRLFPTEVGKERLIKALLRKTEKDCFSSPGKEASYMMSLMDLFGPVRRDMSKATHESMEFLFKGMHPDYVAFCSKIVAHGICLHADQTMDQDEFDKLVDTLVSKAYIDLAIEYDCNAMVLEKAREHMDIVSSRIREQKSMNDVESEAISRIMHRTAFPGNDLLQRFKQPHYVEFRKKRMAKIKDLQFVSEKAFMASELTLLLGMNKKTFYDFVCNEFFIAWNDPLMQNDLSGFFDTVQRNMNAYEEFREAMRSEDPARMKDLEYFTIAFQYHAFPTIYPDAKQKYFEARFGLQRGCYEMLGKCIDLHLLWYSMRKMNRDFGAFIPHLTIYSIMTRGTDYFDEYDLPEAPTTDDLMDIPAYVDFFRKRFEHVATIPNKPTHDLYLYAMCILMQMKPADLSEFFMREAYEAFKGLYVQHGDENNDVVGLHRAKLRGEDKDLEYIPLWIDSSISYANEVNKGNPGKCVVDREEFSITIHDDLTEALDTGKYVSFEMFSACIRFHAQPEKQSNVLKYLVDFCEYNKDTLFQLIGEYVAKEYDLDASQVKDFIAGIQTPEADTWKMSSDHNKLFVDVESFVQAYPVPTA